MEKWLKAGTSPETRTCSKPVFRVFLSPAMFAMAPSSVWRQQSVRDRFPCSLSTSTWRASKPMTDVQQSAKVEQVEAASLVTQFQKVPLFSGISLEELRCLDSVELIHADVGADLMDISRARRGLWILLEGEVRLHKR